MIAAGFGQQRLDGATPPRHLAGGETRIFGLDDVPEPVGQGNHSTSLCQFARGRAPNRHCSRIERAGRLRALTSATSLANHDAVKPDDPASRNFDSGFGSWLTQCGITNFGTGRGSLRRARRGDRDVDCRLASGSVRVPVSDDRARWIEAFRRVRGETERRAAPLSAEDQAIQSMPDASPTKWHRAHTTWFFETFLVQPNVPGYKVFDERFAFLFNSYYVAAGPRHARPEARTDHAAECGRGRGVSRACRCGGRDADRRGERSGAGRRSLRILEIGLNHEEQHQELMLTDILHAFAQNPTNPAYDAELAAAEDRAAKDGFVELPEGIHTIGHQGDGYCFDNEGPSHRVLVGPVRIARALVTNGEWLAFIKDGGYANPALWLSDGWAAVQNEGWQAPGHWQDHDGAWHQLTLGGLQADRSGRAGHARQLLRGRCVRALGRQAPADRAGMGSRGARRAPRRRLRHRVAMDAQRATRPIRALPPATARSANTTANS